MERVFKAPGIDNGYISFKISYDKGEAGVDFFGERAKRGIFLIVTPFVKEGNFRRFGVRHDASGFGMSPFKVFLKALKRKSAKQEEWFFDILESKEAEIQGLIEKRDSRGIQKLALSMAEV